MKGDLTNGQEIADYITQMRRDKRAGTDELRNTVGEKLLRYRNNMGDNRHTYHSGGDRMSYFNGNDEIQGHTLEEIMELIQEQIRLARIEETDLWLNQWGNGIKRIGDGSWEDFHSYRIHRLKTPQEEK